MGITLVDLFAGGVAHHNGAEFGLELLGEMKRHLGRCDGKRRAGGRTGAIEMRMSVSGSRGSQGRGDHESSDTGLKGHEAAAKMLATPA